MDRSNFFIFNAVFILSNFITCVVGGSGMASIFNKIKMNIQLNPDCDILGGDCAHYGMDNYTESVNNLIYYQSYVSSNETLHFVMSSIGAPTLLLIHTDEHAQLEFSWKFLIFGQFGGIFVTNGRAKSAFGLALNKIIKFDDKNDKADVNLASKSDIVAISASHLLWHNVTFLEENIIQLCTTTEGINSRLLGNGTFCIQLDVHDTVGRAKMMPRLLFTENSSQLDFKMKSLFMEGWKQPRLALELIILSDIHLNNVHITETRSIDDEYTPGIFRSCHLDLPHLQGYLMWKPVCYKKSDRDRRSLTQMKFDEIRPFVDVSPPSVLTSYFDVSHSNSPRAFNVTFGYPKDGYYSSTNYTVWSLAVGQGVRPREKFSPLMIATITACFSIPILAALCGCFYFAVVKIRRDSQSDDDQLLINERDINVPT